MTAWYDVYVACFISGALLLFSFFGLWLIAIMPGVEQWSKRFFRVLFIVLVLMCLTGLSETIVYSYDIPVAAMYFMMFCETLFLSLPVPMMTIYLLHCCGENIKSNMLFQVVIVLWTVFIVILACTPITGGLFFYFTPDKQYYRGTWYPVFLMPILVVMLLNIAGIIRYRKKLSRKAFLSFLITLLPFTGVLLVQMFIEIYPLIDICVVLSSLSMYSLILSDQMEQDLRRQKEIANQRNSIMVLQMSPHFIYNTMTAVYCLCEQNPQLARQVIMDFTTYLRKNFTAIASVEPIPFSSELEHTRAYLAVEQAQYEDSLFVDYDTPHTLFRVPPLTLQPIVENAIKHGRDPYAGPFRIFIRTRKTDSGSEIIVADNGRGFVPDDDSEPHTALKNIRQRLEIMCGGSLTITPNEGGGTVVTVMILDNTAKN